MPAYAWLHTQPQDIAWLAITNLDAPVDTSLLHQRLARNHKASALLVDLREARGQRGFALAPLQRWFDNYAGEIIVLLPSGLHGLPEQLALTLLTRRNATLIGQASRGLPGPAYPVDLGAGWSLDVPLAQAMAPLQPHWPARAFSLEDIVGGRDDLMETALDILGVRSNQNNRQPLELRRPVR